MTDVLYILGKGADIIDNLPLRWSLRSLEKHASNVGRVVVAGNIPDWLSDEVVKIPIDDQEQSEDGKNRRIFSCLVRAVAEAGLLKPFLYSSDDHYFVRAADLDSWPHYCHKDSLHTMKTFGDKYKRMPSMYELSLIKTRHLLEEENLPASRRCCLHLNTWIDPVDVATAQDIVNRHKTETKYGFEGHCILGALYASRNPKTEWVEYDKDSKVQTTKDITQKLRRRVPQFSTSPKVETDAKVVKKMNALFPEPCKYEKEA